MRRQGVMEETGRFGRFGGCYIPETLHPAIEELKQCFAEAMDDPSFGRELETLAKEYVGRPTPLFEAKNLSQVSSGARIFLKREDLAHTGAHKINNTLGQALLAKRIGKKRIVAETGAGQHGVSVAAVCALFGLECVVFMGEVDMERQAPNVKRMRLMGAEVRPVTAGDRTLKEAVSEALRYWVTEVSNSHYIIGSVVGPHPFPLMVKSFQSVIGRETRAQMLEREGRLPDTLVACVGAGSNAIGFFTPFLDDEVAMIGVEAAGEGLDKGLHSASVARGKEGVLHGSLSKVLQDEEGQILGAHSLAPGLDYPGVGPEHSHLADIGRVKYESITNQECLAAMMLLCRREGIHAALESSHAVAHALKVARQMPSESIVALCLSGRGDKDVACIPEIGEEGQNEQN